MQYYSGDIVELLNLSANQVYLIQCQGSKGASGGKEAIGMRYELLVGKGFDERTVYKLLGWGHGGGFCFFDYGQFMLYKRPFRNWVKYFKSRIFKRVE